MTTLPTKTEKCPHCGSLTVEALMPFGKHAGKPLKEVPIDYVKWLDHTGYSFKGHPDLRDEFVKVGLLQPIKT